MPRTSRSLRLESHSTWRRKFGLKRVRESPVFRRRQCNMLDPFWCVVRNYGVILTSSLW